MARVVIPVTQVSTFPSSTVITMVTGDKDLDHEIDMSYGPETFLVVRNTAANTVGFAISFNSGESILDQSGKTSGFNIGANAYYIIRLDCPPDLYNIGDTYAKALLINSGDPNMSDLKLGAYTWTRRNYH